MCWRRWVQVHLCLAAALQHVPAHSLDAGTASLQGCSQARASPQRNTLGVLHLLF